MEVESCCCFCCGDDLSGGEQQYTIYMFPLKSMGESHRTHTLGSPDLSSGVVGLNIRKFPLAYVKYHLAYTKLITLE